MSVLHFAPLLTSSNPSAVHGCAERCVFAQQHIAEEAFQIDGSLCHTFLQVAIVGADQSVAEVPRVGGKEVVSDLETERLKIFNHKDCRSAGIALAKGVYLPQVSAEAGEMLIASSIFMPS